MYIRHISFLKFQHTRTCTHILLIPVDLTILFFCQILPFEIICSKHAYKRQCFKHMCDKQNNSHTPSVSISHPQAQKLGVCYFAQQKRLCRCDQVQEPQDGSIILDYPQEPTQLTGAFTSREPLLGVVLKRCGHRKKVRELGTSTQWSTTWL